MSVAPTPERAQPPEPRREESDEELRHLRESEARLRGIFEHSNDAIFVIDPAADRILEANARAAQMLGYSVTELAEIGISAIHPKEMPQLRAFADSVFMRGKGWTDELSCTTKQGQALPAEISASVAPFGGRDCIVAVIRDISERKRAQEALERSERRFRAFVEHAGDGFFVVAGDGQIRDVNARACDMLGYSAAELIGRSVLEIDVGLTGADFAELLEGLEPDRPTLLESRHRRKDGRVFPSEVSICAYEGADGPGGQRQYVALLRDTTERKAAEAAMVRLAEIGELAATIVHQVRNPLATIGMCLDYFARLDLVAGARKRLHLAQLEAERLARLLTDVLDYAGKSPLSPTPCEVNALIRELWPRLEAVEVVAERNLRLVSERSELWIHADRDKLAHALTNLVINASEAVEPGDTVELRVTSAPGAARPGIEVRNGGDPIPAEVLARIGKPFFSTKSSGTGLGVAYVRRIAAAHQWDFEITSSAADGTIARLLL